jgi:hypothetical protein
VVWEGGSAGVFCTYKGTVAVVYCWEFLYVAIEDNTFAKFLTCDLKVFHFFFSA